MKLKTLTDKGFTLVEMVIVCLIFVVVIVITGDAFDRLVSKSLSLKKTAESNIAGIVGLEVMRSDLQAAGYGLPWSFSTAIAYSEATEAPGLSMNDNNSVPRAVVSVNSDPSSLTSPPDSLAIRGQTLAGSKASKRWTYVESQVMPTVNPTPAPYNPSSEQLLPTDRVIMTAAIVNMAPANQLVVNSATGIWNSTYNLYATIGQPPAYSDAEKKSDAYVIYGVNDEGLSTLRMPFNRADYFIKHPTSADAAWFRTPQRCNASTGVLVKGIVSQRDGSYTQIPILECVLDMQVVFSIRNPGTSILTDSSDISALTAQEIREQLKEIKVYILAQDGGRDKNYTYPNATVGVGPGDGITSGSGRTYNFAANSIPDWKNYHWRVYQIVARPNNLAGNAAQ